MSDNNNNDQQAPRHRHLLPRAPRADVDDEIRLHLEMRREEAVRMGLDPERAEAVARERFGDVGEVLERLYEIDRSRERRRSWTEWGADFAQDTRFAVRSLRRAPVFALTAILTLAVAIAANTTIFSFVNALLIEPLPYRDPRALVSVEAGIVGSTGELLALRERSTIFSDLALYRGQSITLNDDDEAARLNGIAVTPNLIRLLGVSPALGTAFTDDESRPGAGNVLLLSHALWMERYGGDRAVVGRQVTVDGAPFRIVGVMPQDFHFPSVNTRFWLPVTINPGDLAATWAIGGSRFVARLRPGVAAPQATAELRRVVPAMRRLNQLWDPGETYGDSARAKPLQASLVREQRPALLVVMGCVVMVLLVACVNLANLMLARVAAREREFTVRAALGGGRGRLIRQLLTESVAIAMIGALLGAALAVAGVRWGLAALPATMARTADVRLSGLVLLFTAVLAVLTGIGFGLLPALRAASVAGSAGAAHLGRGAAARSRDRLSGVLVVAEVALAVLLAITAGLLTRSFGELQRLSPGFQTDRVLSARISPPSGSYASAARTSAFYVDVLERMSATPGVTAVGLVDRLPIAAPVYGMGMRVEGQFEDATRALPSADHLQNVTPGYLPALGVSVLRGRAISEADRADSPPVAVVSQSLARRFWPHDDPIGKRIGYPYASPWITIVGVVPDMKLDSLRDTASMAVLLPFAQRSRFASPEMGIVIRSSADPAAIARQLRAVVSTIDRSVPVTSVRTMTEVLAGSVERPRFTMVLVGGFALAALLLGATGIYGVMSYVVSRRSQEMGIRLALGATARDIGWLVVGRGAALAAAGAIAGCALAVVGTRALGSLLYGLKATDPITFLMVPAMFVGIAMMASIGPALRATRADPARTMRDS